MGNKKSQRVNVNASKRECDFFFLNFHENKIK